MKREFQDTIEKILDDYGSISFPSQIVALVNVSLNWKCMSSQHVY